jgi:peptidoglycan hydrolase CwlO-like protein
MERAAPSSSMSSGGPEHPYDATHAHVQAARESRWRGQGYADVTKLRELSAKHDRIGGRLISRQARILTKIERLRHQSTVLREKATDLRNRIPEIQQQMTQNDRVIREATERTKGIVIGSDITALQYKNQKFQQKIVDLQAKAQRLEHRAAMKTQKSAELKVKADGLLERAHQEQLEGQAFRDRADRLQRATEAVVVGGEGAGSAPSPPHA